MRDMNKHEETKAPVLVIMAAGMGSRYGGMKQIDPVDEEGHILMDYSIYDAKQAGFEEVVFIIKRENEADFRERIGDRIAESMRVAYAFQELTDLPGGFSVPEGRIKPWGTGHAVLAARHVIHGPFAVINADDYYGRESFSLIYRFLTQTADDALYRFAMVGYTLKKTVTENGHVARGICHVDENGCLTDITERTMIRKTPDGTAWSEDEGKTWHDVSPESLVSMNMWGFSEAMIPELEARFGAFLQKNLPANPLKCEYFLPFVVDELLQEGKAVVKVLPTQDTWYGLTYKEDKQAVTAALSSMKAKGMYPAAF